LFAEVNVPLYANDSGQKLDSTFAYRSSDYSASGRVPSWKMGLNATVVEDLRLRYTKSHDVREPNFAERYLTGTGGGTVQDKQLNNVTNASLTILATPNTNLSVEEADTVTAGFVYQPSFADWVDGVQIALDWYEITLTGAIARYGAQRIADDCFATKDAHTCALIARDPNTQTITRILDEYVNVGGAQTRGVDLELQYTMEPNLFGSQDESLSVRALAGYLGENSTTSAAGTTVDAVGGTERAQNTGNISLSYTIGNYGIRAVANYYGDTLVNTLWTEGVDIDDNHVASQTTFNLGLLYGKEMARGGDWTATFSISNLFDRDPPIIPGAGGQVLSNSHDQFGRRYQVSLDMNF
jgi:iron complex outermembrane recepter protein